MKWFSKCRPAAVIPVQAMRQPCAHQRQDKWDTLTDWLTAEDKRLSPGHASKVCQFNYYKHMCILLQVYTWTSWTDPTDTLNMCLLTTENHDQADCSHSMPKANAQQRPTDTTHCTTLASHHHYRSIFLPLLQTYVARGYWRRLSNQLQHELSRWYRTGSDLLPCELPAAHSNPTHAQWSTL